MSYFCLEGRTSHKRNVRNNNTKLEKPCLHSWECVYLAETEIL